MTKKIGVVVMAALLLLYIAAASRTAVNLMTSGDGVALAMGIALALLPLLAIWALVAELLFGVRSEQLLTRLEAEGGLPAEQLPSRASGRPEREAADAAFPAYRAEVESNPQAWQSWLRLGLAYDACGDRRRARSSVRRAIALARAASDR